MLAVYTLYFQLFKARWPDLQRRALRIYQFICGANCIQLGSGHWQAPTLILSHPSCEKSSVSLELLSASAVGAACFMRSRAWRFALFKILPQVEFQPTAILLVWIIVCGCAGLAWLLSATNLPRDLPQLVNVLLSTMFLGCFYQSAPSPGVGGLCCCLISYLSSKRPVPC